MKIMDYFQLEGSLNEEEKSLRDKVRKFVDEECVPLIAGHFDGGTFPMEVIPRMGEMGLFGIHVDGYGCTQASHTIYGLICQELGRCDSGLRAMFSVQNSLVMYPIYAFGSEEQKARWLPKMSTGGCNWLFRSLRTRFWIGSFGNEDQGREARESLPPERNQDVDYQWFHGTRGTGLGEDGW